MSAEKFLEHLAASGLLDDSILAKLREKISQSEKNVTIETIVKVLMDQGHLTRFQATKQISNYSAGLKSEAKTDPSLQSPEKTSQKAAGQELGFAADDSLDGHPGLHGLQQKVDSAAAAETSADEAVEEIVELEDASASELNEQFSSAGHQGMPSPPSLSPAPTGLEADPLDGPLDEVSADPLVGEFSQQVERPIQPADGGELHLPSPPPNQWDTKLIIGGSLVLGILVISLFGLYFLLRSGSAAEVFEAAEKDYNTGAYANSIEKYKLFLKKYPRHEKANLAWVRQKMAGLRQNSGSPKKAMEVALRELPELRGQPAFGEVRAELASLLPGIAEGFADKAANAKEINKKKELVGDAKQAMSQLVEEASYIPSKLRANPDVRSRIQRIREKIEAVNRDIAREDNLVAAVKTIIKLTDDGKTAEAFLARHTLLGTYPNLEDHPRLIEVVGLISKKERELVRVLDTKIVALTGERAGSTDLEIKIFFTRTGKDIPGVAGHVCCVLAGGAVYGIDVSTGNVRWRRFVGAETAIQPQPLSDQPDADALLVNSRHELVRINSQTGELVWRLPVAEPFLRPVIYNESLLLNTRSGKMLVVNLKTGRTNSVVEFPKGMGTSVTYADEQPLLYQLGDEHNLYVINSETMECLEVLYIGHKKGSIHVPPVYAVGFLLLVENLGLDAAAVHVYAMNDKGRKLKEIQTIRLDGNVVVPCQVFERRLLVATDRGAIHVYDVDPNIDPPLQRLANVNSSTTKSFINYPIVYRGQVWMAGETLAKYRVQPALSKLNRIWIKDEGDTFVAPLKRVEDVLIHTRRRNGADAITVSGQPVDSETPFWQTDLGAPTKVSLDRKNNRLRALSAQAGYFQITADDLETPVMQRPSLVNQQGEQLTFNRLVEFSSGRLAVTGPQRQNKVLVIDPAAKEAKPRLVALQPYGTKSGSAVGFQDLLLVPFQEGMIRLFDLQDGRQHVKPFQPALSPGDRKSWSAPVIDRHEPGKFVVLQDRHILYRVGIKEQPQPHLAAFQQRTLEQPVIGPVAALGDTLYTVAREADHDVVVTLQLPGFEDDYQWHLQGRVMWGPVRVNDRVFVVSDREGLLCFDNQWAWWRTSAVLRWQTKLPYGPLAGMPLKQKGSYVLASTNGTVWRIDRETGQELQKVPPVRLKKPLWGNPVAHDGQLWLSGIDGVVYVIPFPPAT